MHPSDAVANFKPISEFSILDTFDEVFKPALDRASKNVASEFKATLGLGIPIDFKFNNNNVRASYASLSSSVKRVVSRGS